MSDELQPSHAKNFEDIRHVDSLGNEYWFARELAPLLEYQEWRNFRRVIEKAKEACKRSKINELDHFVDINKMVTLGSGAKRELDDVRLSRYACYLILQNGDPSKSVIANGQTYFAVQTRRQELEDEVNSKNLSEEQKRLLLRTELSQHNKNLAATAKDSGVKTTIDYAIFQNHGYKGLYGGLDSKSIHQRKKLKKSEKILDHMGSTELAANLFRATQTEEILKRDKAAGKHQANQMHHHVGMKVRQTIKELGGTMPEDLPTPEKGIKQLEREHKKMIRKGEKSSE